MVIRLSRIILKMSSFGTLKHGWTDWMTRKLIFSLEEVQKVEKN